jgi:hypothetical protein
MLCANAFMYSSLQLCEELRIIAPLRTDVPSILPVLQGSLANENCFLDPALAKKLEVTPDNRTPLPETHQALSHPLNVQPSTPIIRNLYQVAYEQQPFMSGTSKVLKTNHRRAHKR